MKLLTNWESIYNCIAKLARFVNDNAKKEDYISYTTTVMESPNSYINLDGILDKKLNGILYDLSGTISINSDNFALIKDLIISSTDELIERSNLPEIFIFLEILDHALFENIMSESWKEELAEAQYLNSNYTETGIGILPYYHCGWDISSERFNRSHDLNVFINNFLIIDLNNLDDIYVKNFFIDSNIQLNKTYLKVGLSPLWRWVNFKFRKEVENGNKVINIEYCSNSEKENDIICKTIDKATEENVDILVFPEMLGNSEMSKSIRKKLIKSRPEYPQIIVLPSIWNNGTNKSRVVDRYGIEIFEQGKRNPFIGKDLFCENLDPYNELNVMHIRGFGRILIMICRDFLEVRSLQKILDELRPTMILVPSFSTGYHDFNRVKGICEGHECAVVWVNSCADRKNNDPFGFIDKAGHSFRSDSDRLNVFPDSENGNDECYRCEEDCEYKICLYVGTLINPGAGKDDHDG